MDSLAELYQDLVLDHGKQPRNHREMAEANHRAEGFNPLCGDRVQVFLSLDGDVIADASFLGSACAICTASASLMTQHVKGRSTASALEESAAFQDLVTGRRDVPEEPTRLAALAGVRKYPMRVKCATLPWHTMRAALEARDDPVTTE